MASQAVGAVLLEPEDQVMYAFWPEVQSPKVQVLPSWLTHDWDGQTEGGGRGGRCMCMCV